VWCWEPKWDCPRKRTLIVREDRAGDFKYTLTKLSDIQVPQRLAYIQGQRFWIEHAFQEAKSQLGMAQYQVRVWRGWHHHMALVALAMLFTLGEQSKSKPHAPLLSVRDLTELLDHYLTAFEAANGIARGSTPLIVLVTETAEAMFHTGDYKGAPRVVALTWGAEDLADSIGASSNRNDDGSYGFTYELARSMCLLGAATAGVTAIETIQDDFRDLDGLKARAEKVRRDGYRGMLAIHPAQVDVINAAFTPTEEEIAEAQAIVDIFAANPGVGAIGYKGGMLDRPYLSRAEQLLRQVGAS
jgi:hypothetical protein